MSIKGFLYIILTVFAFYLITLVLDNTFWEFLTGGFLIGAVLFMRHIAENEK